MIVRKKTMQTLQITQVTIDNNDQSLSQGLGHGAVEAEVLNCKH